MPSYYEDPVTTYMRRKRYAEALGQPTGVEQGYDVLLPALSAKSLEAVRMQELEDVKAERKKDRQYNYAALNLYRENANRIADIQEQAYSDQATAGYGKLALTLATSDVGEKALSGGWNYLTGKESAVSPTSTRISAVGTVPAQQAIATEGSQWTAAELAGVQAEDAIAAGNASSTLTSEGAALGETVAETTAESSALGTAGGVFSAATVGYSVGGALAKLFKAEDSSGAAVGLVGGALAGAAIGTYVFPGIGTGVGAIFGGVFGAVGGGK